MTDPAALEDAELRERFRVLDAQWETDRRAGRWNRAQREERNALADELLRRQGPKGVWEGAPYFWHHCTSCQTWTTSSHQCRA